MAECGGAEYLLAAELMCPVCLSTYQDPESLSCGHSFCRDCIHKVLASQIDQDRSYSCPMCQAEYEEFPELQRNFQLCSIVQTVSDLHKEGSGESCVFCSYCLGDPFPAVKTCLNCEVSLCLQHPERHRKKSHVLVEPTESVEERKCPEHDQLLEYYCENDQSCICVTCCISGSHKGHSIMTLKEAREKHLTTLSQMVSSLQDSERDISKDLEEMHKGLETLKENALNLSAPVTDLFQEILSKVEHERQTILNAITSNEEAKTLEMRSITKQMEQKRAEALHISQDLETMRGQGDDLLFLKSFGRSQEKFKQDFKTKKQKVSYVQIDQSMIAEIQKETASYISMISFLLIMVHRKIHVQNMGWPWAAGSRQPVQQPAQPTPSSFLYKQPVEDYELDLYFKYQTSRNIPHVYISNGNKRATFQRNPRKVRDQLSRFPNGSDLYITINLGRIIADRVFWLVDVSQARKWCVGVADRTHPIDNTDTWYLKWDGSNLSYVAGDTFTLLPKRIDVVKVVLDFDDHIIGFYNIREGSEEEKLLLKYRCDAFEHNLCAGFGGMSGSLTLL